MSTEHYRPIDTQEIKRVVDLVEYIGRHTTLVQVSRVGEYAGPCPRCGGTDRFHVKDERFYCRQCLPRGGDVIDFVQWLHGVGFREACARLGAELATDPHVAGAEPTVRATTSPASQQQEAKQEQPVWQTERFQRSAQRTLAATRRRLWSEEGTPGWSYLQARGLTEETARAFGLGYGVTFHPRRRKNLPAIFLPWYSEDGKRVRAVQHRFIADDLDKNERYSMKFGSDPVLFGLNVLKPAETVAVVEGEFNCMALQQSGIQALSLGSEANVGNRQALAALPEYLVRYRRIVVWFDQLDRADALVSQLREAEPFREKELQGVASHQDANAYLMANALLNFWHEIR